MGMSDQDRYYMQRARTLAQAEMHDEQARQFADKVEKLDPGAQVLSISVKRPADDKGGMYEATIYIASGGKRRKMRGRSTTSFDAQMQALENGYQSELPF
jgi:hypothetical protein